MTHYGPQTEVLAFIKQAWNWHADLPEFLDAGLRTRANLMMADGADTFLKHLSQGTSRITTQIPIQSNG